jgi:DNA-binding NtrC family response regulator
MAKRILSVSYDDILLTVREMLLTEQGYEVTSALGFTAAVDQCQKSHFDLFILGHSIPDRDKIHLIQTFKENCPAPIVSLERIGESRVPSDFHASPDDPAKFVKVVDDILSGKEQRSQQQPA